MRASLKEEGGKIIADEGDFQIEIPPHLADPVRASVGKDVLFGIRPEDMVYSETPNKTNDIPAKVQVVEPLGSEIHLYVNTSSNTVVASVSPRFEFHVGDEVHFAPDMEKLHFFDLETEKAFF